MSQRILITGATGFLGNHLWQAAAGDWEVWAVGGLRRPADFPSIRWLDVSDPAQLRSLLDEARPAAIVHAAACARPDDCQRRPADTRRVNVDSVELLARWCGDHDAALAFISSDLVFDGRRGPYAEDDPTGPVNEYGRQKADAERLVLRHCPRGLVCRLPLMFGDARPPAASFLQGTLSRWRAGETLDVFVDEFRTPIDGALAAQGVLKALSQGLGGTLHLGGPQRVSRFELARVIGRTFELPESQLRPCHQAEVASLAPRPADVSLSSELARRALEFEPPPLRQQLAKVARAMRAQGT